MNTQILIRRQLMQLSQVDALQINFDAPIFLSNAAAAFGLNMSVFLLIGKTSALTMNIAGVIKDWMLIGLSVVLFKAVSKSRFYVFQLTPYYRNCTKLPKAPGTALWHAQASNAAWQGHDSLDFKSCLYWYHVNRKHHKECMKCNTQCS